MPIGIKLPIKIPPPALIDNVSVSDSMLLEEVLAPPYHTFTFIPTELKVQAYFYHTIEIETFNLDKGNLMMINVFNFDTVVKYIYLSSNLLDIEFGRMS
jgi:hypothetical protein